MEREERARLDHLSDREKEEYFNQLEEQDRQNALKDAAALAAGDGEQSITDSSEMHRAELRRKEEEARADLKLQGTMRRFAALIRDDADRCRWCGKACELIDGRWHHPLPLEACSGPPVKLTSTGRVAPVEKQQHLAIVGGSPDLSSETYKQRLAQQRASDISTIRNARPRKTGGSDE